MAIFLIFFVVLLLIGAPISIAIGAGATAGCIALGYPLQIVGQKMVTGVDSYLLIAVPLFIFAGNLMNEGKITTKIFDFAQSLVGWIPGGLGHANIVASIIFAGMSGSAAADAGGLGVIEMKAMRDNGYDDAFSAAVTSASSVIGPIFPPSIPLIIYGSVASVSVAKLFMGGVLPGLLMGLALMILVFIFAVKRGYERTPFRLKVLWESFKGSILSLITPLIILAGFTTGWVTPTEASCIAVVYSLVISAFVYRSLGLKKFLECAKESALGAANTLFIIGTSTLFTYGRHLEGYCKLYPRHQLESGNHSSDNQHHPSGTWYVYGARCDSDPDAPGTGTDRSGHRTGPRSFRCCDGSEPDDRSGYTTVWCLPVHYLGSCTREARNSL